MVDKRALQLAALAAGGLLFLLVTGQVLRLLTRWLSWAILVGFVVLFAYVTYELYSGWTTGADDEAIGESVPADDRSAPLDAPPEQFDAGELSDEEFEAELEGLVGGTDDAEREYEAR